MAETFQRKSPNIYDSNELEAHLSVKDTLKKKNKGHKKCLTYDNLLE